MKKMIEFFSENCAPCKILEPILNEIEKENKVTIAKINIDNNKDLIEVYDISSVPTILFLDGKGNILDRKIGLASKEEILNTLGGIKDD